MLAQEIGGGIVRRGFTMGAERVRSGRELTKEELLSMPPANRNALVEKKYIELYPERPAAPGQRHVVSAGFGRFDVIEGRKLNASPMTKEEANKLAGKKKGKKRR